MVVVQINDGTDTDDENGMEDERGIVEETKLLLAKKLDRLLIMALLCALDNELSNELLCRAELLDDFPELDDEATATIGIAQIGRAESGLKHNIPHTYPIPLAPRGSTQP